MNDLSKIKPGDIIGFSGTGFVSGVINLGTFALPRCGLSHVGIVSEYEGELLLFESTFMAADNVPCVIAGQPVRGVQAHTLESAVSRKGAVWHYPVHYSLGTS
jgi:hypothetical protein